jgi:hypothetical protein
MITRDEVRRIALTLPEVTETGHFSAPAFSVAGKMFAVLREEGRVTLRLELEDQINLIALQPEQFLRVQGGARNDRAGREGWTYCAYETCNPSDTGRALRLAWSSVAPKRLDKEIGEWTG